MTAWQRIVASITTDYIRKLDNADLHHANDIPRRHIAYDSTLCELLESLGFEDLVKRYRRDTQWYGPLPSERSRAGIASHRKNGNRWGASSKFHDPENVELARSLLREGPLSKSKIARRIGVHPVTLYRWFPGGEADNFLPTPTFHRRQKQRAQR